MPVELLLLAAAVLCIALARAIEESSPPSRGASRREKSAPAPSPGPAVGPRERSQRERGG